MTRSSERVSPNEAPPPSLRLNLLQTSYDLSPRTAGARDPNPVQSEATFLDLGEKAEADASLILRAGQVGHVQPAQFLRKGAWLGWQASRAHLRPLPTTRASESKSVRIY